MNWRDLFYFSRGERRALTLLFVLITLTWIAILYTDTHRTPATEKRATALAATDTTPPDSAARPSKQTRPTPRPNEKERKTPDAAKPSRRFASYSTSRSYKPRYPKVEKYPPGTVIDLNMADTTELKKIPGIGSVFARRIVRYRKALGGFYTVEQLGEVYGIDEERYRSMKSWFSVSVSAICQLNVNQMSAKELAAHPYVSYRQARAIEELVRRKGHLRGWEELSLLEEFTEADRERLLPYLSFAP